MCRSLKSRIMQAVSCKDWNKYWSCITLCSVGLKIMWQLMQATSSTFQNTLRADFHHPYFVTPVSCLKRPKESRAPQISKNMCLLLIQQPSKTDIWGLPLCVIQPCNSLHLLCWQEDIKSQIESPLLIRIECADVPISACRVWAVLEVSAVFTLLLFSELCAEIKIKTVSCVLMRGSYRNVRLDHMASW